MLRELNTGDFTSAAAQFDLLWDRAGGAGRLLDCSVGARRRRIYSEVRRWIYPAPA